MIYYAHETYCVTKRTGEETVRGKREKKKKAERTKDNAYCYMT